MPIMSAAFANAFAPIVALLAIAFGAFLTWRVAQVRVRGRGGDAGREYLLDEAAQGEDEVSLGGGWEICGLPARRHLWWRAASRAGACWARAWACVRKRGDAGGRRRERAGGGGRRVLQCHVVTPFPRGPRRSDAPEGVNPALPFPHRPPRAHGVIASRRERCEGSDAGAARPRALARKHDDAASPFRRFAEQGGLPPPGLCVPLSVTPHSCVTRIPTCRRVPEGAGRAGWRVGAARGGRALERG